MRSNFLLKFTVVTAAMLFAAPAFAKRTIPPEVLALKKSGVEYSFHIDNVPCKSGDKSCGMKLFLSAVNSPSTNPQWKTELYQKNYNSDLELDVQTVLPVSLKWDKDGRLVLIDERGSRYIVDAKTGALVYPSKPNLYPAG